MAETSSPNRAATTALSETGTASESIIAPTLSQTRLMASRLTDDVGGSRSEARTHHEDWDDLHQQSHDVEWRTATVVRAKASVATMLSDIADLGFAWRDVARLVGVSVPAVQKWRKGEKSSGENRRRLAGFLAACDLISEHYLVDEISSWFELPLSPHAPVTPIDLYAKERIDLVFEFASGHRDPEAVLDEFEPDWRERYRSDFEVFEASDGNRSIRSKG